VTSCPFCSCEDEVLFSNALAFVIEDSFPVNRGHLLVIPFRHVESVFDLTPQEGQAAFSLLEQAQAYLDQEYAPDGYNVGVNVGQAAGQTIPHVHIHVIPRYRGDVPSPRGGVRGVIPHKQSY
jgi:diadenosine tetraphosphate (Ap4A) HIT family hydrolase